MLGSFAIAMSQTELEGRIRRPDFDMQGDYPAESFFAHTWSNSIRFMTSPWPAWEAVVQPFEPKTDVSEGKDRQHIVYCMWQASSLLRPVSLEYTDINLSP